MQFLNNLQAYMKQPKVFVTDINRAKEFYTAVDIAKRLFPETEIKIKDDLLQTGAMIFEFVAFDVVVRGAMELALFSDMISLADNFEIYPISREKVRFGAVFQSVNKRIK